jgi:hypothetical protein
MGVWVDEIDFDTYSTGNLSGQDGWTFHSGSDLQVVSTPTDTGSRAIAAVSAGGNFRDYRSITTVNTDGAIVYFSIRTDTNTSVDNMGLFFANGTTVCAQVMINAPSAGYISLRQRVSPYGWTTLTTGVSNDTWYRVGIEFDFTNNRFRGNVDNGTWSVWEDMASTSQINRIDMLANNGDGASTACYIDSISASYSPGGGGATFTPKVMWFS